MHRMDFETAAMVLLVLAPLFGCSPSEGDARTIPPGARDDHSGHAHAATSSAQDGHAAEEICGEHAVPEAQCGICRPEAVERLSAGSGMLVRMPSPQAAGKAGIVTRRVDGALGAAVLSLVGELQYNRNRFARVTPMTAGVVRSVAADAGRPVREGEVLAVIASAEAAQARAALADALAEDAAAERALAREEDLFARRVSSEVEMLETRARHESAHAAAQAARASLQSLGADPAEGAEDPALLSLRAPLAGLVLSRAVVVGDRVSPGDALFEVADVRTLWVSLAVPPAHAASLRPGAPVLLQTDALPERTLEATLQWVASGADPRTRLVEARAEVSNPDGALRAGMFVSARLAADPGAEGFVIPREAVQRIGSGSMVFLRREADLFEARRVDAVAISAAEVVILAGLAEGEEIVVEGSFLMKSELQKARLGAGCAD